MFQATDANGDGVVSKAEFENFYNQFMGASSTSGSSPSTMAAAADRLYQQLSVTGNGLTQSQFASAVKLMMSQKAQGLPPHHGLGVGGTAGSVGSSLAAASSASINSATWLEKILASGNQNATGQTASAQNNGSMEFIA
jgi:hypothetical protein